MAAHRRRVPGPGSETELCDPGLPRWVPCPRSATALVGTPAPFHVALDLHVCPIRRRGRARDCSAGYSGCGGSSSRIPSSFSGRVGVRRRRARQRVDAARDLRERGHLAQVGLAARARAMKRSMPHREAAVRRRAHRSASRRKPNLSRCSSSSDAHHAEDGLPARPRWWIRIEPGAELPAVPDQVVVLAAHVRGIGLDPLLLARHRRGEGVVHERPAAVLLAVLEEREVGDPVEDVEVSVDQAELVREVQPEQPEDARDGLLLVGDEERRRPLFDAERLRARARRGTSRSASGSRAPWPPTPSRAPRAAPARCARTSAARRRSARTARS